MAGPTIEEVLKTEFSPEFVEGMKQRMVVSFHKYGFLTDAYPHKVNALDSLIKRLEKYRDTGNTEFLMDAANFAMIEYMFPSQNNAHFKGTDDEESPGRVAARTGRLDKRDNLEIGRGDHVSPLLRFRGED